MSVFHFQPTPGESEIRFRLKDGTLTLLGDDGWSVDLADVTRIGLVDQTARGMRQTRMDMDAGEMRSTLSLAHPARDWASSAHSKQFLALIKAISASLEKTHPDLQVTLGEFPKSRKTGFIVGIASAVGGVILLVLALWKGVGENRLITALVPAAVLVVLGALTTRAFWPGTRLQTAPIAEMPKIIEFLRSGPTKS